MSFNFRSRIAGDENLKHLSQHELKMTWLLAVSLWRITTGQKGACLAILYSVCRVTFSLCATADAERGRQFERSGRRGGRHTEPGSDGSRGGVVREGQGGGGWDIERSKEGREGSRGVGMNRESKKNSRQGRVKR